MSPSDAVGQVAAVREFNRFYTQRIGVLTEAYLESPFSLTEARVIYELAHHDAATATSLCKGLGVDAGYLSRILRGFKKRGLIEARPSGADRRLSLIKLTASGQQAFAFLDTHSQNEIEALLNRMRTEDRNRLIAAMQTVQRLIGANPRSQASYLLRPHQPGDMGWWSSATACCMPKSTGGMNTLKR